MKEEILKKLKENYKDLDFKIIKNKIYINDFDSNIKVELYENKKFNSKTLEEYYIECIYDDLIKKINKFLGE